MRAHTTRRIRKAAWGSALGVLLIAGGPIGCPPKCTIQGTDGDDVGPNALIGTPNKDVICGYEGNDHIDGRGGDDILIGGPGNDVIDGGDGNDQVYYAGSTRGVRVDLDAGSAIPYGGGTGLGDGTDQLVSIRRVVGTRFGDQLIGNSGDNELEGGSGNDELFGMQGNDRLAGGPGDDLLDGGGGQDWADYSSAGSGVWVDLAAGTAGPWFFGGGQGDDDLVSIRHVQGSWYSDYLVGDANDNVLNGGAGVDLLLGGAGADTLRGEADGDRLFGEQGADELRGDGGEDFLSGGPGNDDLYGGDESDWASYADASDTVWVSGSNGADPGAASGADGSDTLNGIENLEGSVHPDVLSATGTVRGLGGGDWLAGTEVDYSWSTSGVEVDLAAVANQPGSATGEGWEDVLTGFRDIIGSNHDDVLDGNDQKNRILGGGGADVLIGRGQDDTLDGQAGNDSADGGNGTDTCVAESTTSCEL